MKHSFYLRFSRSVLKMYFLDVNKLQNSCICTHSGGAFSWQEQCTFGSPFLNASCGPCDIQKIKAFHNISQSRVGPSLWAKDLGVIFDADLKLDEHISAKIRKVNTMVGLIWRSLSYLEGLLFTAFVRRHLACGQVILGSVLKKAFQYTWKLIASFY